jgi:hypothetical protein
MVAPQNSVLINLFKGGSENVVISIKQLTDLAQSSPHKVNCCGECDDEDDSGSDDDSIAEEGDDCVE